MYNESIECAKSLKNKQTMYEAYCGKAHVLLLLKDYESARHALKKAFFLFPKQSCLNESAKRCIKLIERVLRCVRRLDSTSTSDRDKVKVFDQLGDLFVELRCFSTAIDYYGQQLRLCQSLNADDSVLAVIYMSLGQTCIDNRQFTEAIDYFEKELACYRHSVSDQVRIRLKMIEAEINLERNNEVVIDHYRKLLSICGSDVRLKRSVYDEFYQFLNEISDCKELYLDALNEVERERKSLRRRCADDLLDEVDHSNTANHASPEGTTNVHIDLSEVSDLTSDSDDDEKSEEFGQRKVRNRKTRRGLDEKRNEKGETPLHRACIEGNLGQVEKLLEKGHKVNVRDHCGWLPIHEAANHGFADIVELLVKHKAWVSDPGGKECEGTTPLHDSCTNGHTDVIRALLNSNANVMAVDYYGNTPLDCLNRYLKRTRNLSRSERSEYDQLLTEMQEQMKKRGYDGKRTTMKRPFSVLETNTPRRRPSSSMLDLDSLDSESIGMNSPCKNYSFGRSSDASLLTSPPRKTSCLSTTDKRPSTSVAKNMRRNADPSSDRFRSGGNHVDATKSLIDEDHIVDDDWLDDDLGMNERAKKQTYYDLYEMKRVIDRNTSVKTKTRKTIDDHRSLNNRTEDETRDLNGIHDIDNREDYMLDDNSEVDQIVLDDDHDSDFDNKKRAALSDEDVQIWSDHESVKERGLPTLSTLKITSKAKNDIETSLSSQMASAGFRSKEKEKEKESDLTSNEPAKVKIRVHIEDMILLIPVAGTQPTVGRLEREIVERYYKLKKVRPVLTIETMDKAIVSSDDLLSDVLNSNEVRACIQSWNVRPLHEIYRTECDQSQVEPIVDIEFECRMAGSSAILNFRQSHWSLPHLKALLPAFRMQNQLRTLDFSYSNFVQLDAAILELFPAIASIESLQTLNLEGTGLIEAQLAQLASISFPQLTDLNLNYNCLRGLDSILVQVMRKHEGLRNLWLQFCDVTSELTSDLTFNQTLEQRELRVHIDPFVCAGIGMSNKLVVLDSHPLVELTPRLQFDFDRCLLLN